MDLLEVIRGWVRSTPDRPAHVSGSRTLSYGELGRRSDALAHALIEAYPGDRSPVAVLGHKEPEMLIGFLGAVKAGRPYVPIDTSLPMQRQERIVRLAEAGVRLSPGRIQALSAGEGLSPTGEIGPPLLPSDPVYIIFTSGSTGDPKGVIITAGCLTSFLTWMLAEHPLAPGQETFLNQAPFSFDLSVMDLYLSLVTGGTLFSLTSDDIANPGRLYTALECSRATVWVSTPSFAQMCLAEPAFVAAMLPDIRRFLFCGETLPPGVAGHLLDRFPSAEVWNTYGPTEATVATTSVQVTRAVVDRYPELPVGVPKPGTRILLQDEAGDPVPDGQRGEVVIAGPNVSPGYLDSPALTQRAFFSLDGERAYRTGDYGRMIDGMLFFEGRIDDQVKVNGYRIELGDVEANLRADPQVRDAVVVPVRRPGHPDALAAFVIPAARSSQGAPDSAERAGADGDAGLIRALRSRLAARVPVYMLPRRIVLVETFPMNGNGKADRRALAASLATARAERARTSSPA